MLMGIDQLDLATVLKLSQAVQGETGLAALIAAIMRLSVEHSGAQRSLLIAPHRDGHRIEAEAKRSREGVTVELRQANISVDDLPQSVLQYVLRTRERVLLEDASAAGEFIEDEYLRRHRGRSVLCFALLRQTELAGVIYLENNLTPNAFTPDQIALLEVLASGAVIYLENAGPYRDLQERETRVSQIIDANLIGFAIWHADGRILDANDEFLRMTGYDRADLVSDRVRWAALTAPEDRGAVARTLKKVQTTRAGQTAEEREFLRKDGSKVPVLAGGSTFPGMTDQGFGFTIDLTELKPALHESERETRLIVETIPGIVSTLTPTGEVESVNSNFVAYCGLGLEDLKLWATNGTIHVDDVPQSVEILARGLTSGDPWEIDARMRRYDGAYRWFRARGLPLRDMDRQIVRWYVLLSDIDDRKSAEEALAKRERELRVLVDTIPALMWRGTSAGDLDYLNERAVEYLGHTAEDLSGGRWLELIHPDHRDAAARRWLHSVTTGSSYDDIYKLRRADGQFRWIHSVGKALRDSEGRIVHWYGSVNDIDDLKRIEEALRESERESRVIIETIPGLVAMVTPAGEVEAVNERTLAYFGRTLEELQQREWKGSIHPDDLTRTTEVFSHSMKSGDPHEIVNRIRRFDGVYRWFQVRGLPLRGSNGSIVRWYFLLTDIEELKRSEAELTALKDQLHKENLVLRDEVERTSMFEEIVGMSPALQPVLSRVVKVARTDSTVLITGETGTGKELVARAIHRRSARASRAFVSVNCAAIPHDLIASELFGHEKGAFTGATQQRLGRFELAHGGTIFLDEVGELPMETQVALLRVLQEREFERVGGSAPIRVDVRVVAATNRDLQAAIEAGTFRSDLFYRLNVFPVAVPALRERADDIPLLVEYFIDRYARKAGKTIRRVNKRTLERLRSYPWPGNVRELQNVIERSVIVCDTDEFRVDESWVAARPDIEGRLALPGSLAAHEKAIIEDALRASGGRVFGPSGAAARLGIPRSTLESRIRALKINKARYRPRPAKS
jgi:formate hydrogenlyase transcriptional activator